MKAKKLLMASVAVVIMVPSFQSCKKGENDPGISFSSRQARAAGEWTVSNMSMENTYTDDDGDVSKMESTYSGSTETVISTNVDGDKVTTVYTYSERMITLEKDGNYSETWTRRKTSVAVDYADASITDPPATIFEDQLDGGIAETMTKTGTWSFLTADDAAGYKNKERIIFNVTSQTESGPDQYFDPSTFEFLWGTETTTESMGNGEMSTIVPITQLKGKEMIVEGDFAGSWDYMTTDPNGFEGNDSYTNSFSMTLTQD